MVAHQGGWDEILLLALPLLLGVWLLWLANRRAEARMAAQEAGTGDTDPEEPPMTITDFDSSSCAFNRFDSERMTLYVDLKKERDDLRVHSFAFTVGLAPAPEALTVSIDNAGRSQYRTAWHHHVPYVRRADLWQRLERPGEYDGERFVFRVDDPGPHPGVAWYEPYPLERLRLFVDGVLRSHPAVTVEDRANGSWLITVGAERAPTVVIVARQHPGEGIGSFVLEGLLRRLLSLDGVQRALRFMIVPVMNIDGLREGLHRFDSHGRDYNRSWSAASAPEEVVFVRGLLDGCDDLFAFVDLHGDELSKASFVDYRMNRGVREARLHAYRKLLDRLADGSPKLFVRRSEPFVKRFVKALLRQHRLISPGATTANVFVAKRYPTLALTFEPSVHAMTPLEAEALGAAFVQHLAGLEVGDNVGGRA